MYASSVGSVSAGGRLVASAAVARWACQIKKPDNINLRCWDLHTNSQQTAIKQMQTPNPSISSLHVVVIITHLVCNEALVGAGFE